MSRNEILRNQRWRLGIILHAEEVSLKKVSLHKVGGTG